MPLSMSRQRGLAEFDAATLAEARRFNRRLGWAPRLSTAWTVAMTADWYRTCARGTEDMRAFSQAQIDFYTGTLDAGTSGDITEGKVAACA